MAQVVSRPPQDGQFLDIFRNQIKQWTLRRLPFHFRRNQSRRFVFQFLNQLVQLLLCNLLVGYLQGDVPHFAVTGEFDTRTV